MAQAPITKSGTVPGIYAAALLAAAGERGEADGAAAAAARLAPAFDIATVQRIQDPRLGRARAKEILRLVAAQAGAPRTLADFLCLLLDRHRLADASAILSEAARLHAVATGHTPVAVALAADPSAALRERIVAAVRSAVGTQAEVAVSVDPTLIGGIRVRHGDKLVDASVRRRLDDLAKLAKSVTVSDGWWSDTAITTP
jgi:F-type H+-transporting ATPase subunit delta